MNDRKKVELQVSSLSNSQTQGGAFILQLTEVGTRRSFPIVIGVAEAQAIMLELRGLNPPRPLTYVLFASVLQALVVRLLRVLIYNIENGVFYSYLYLRSGALMLRVDSRTSDAIAMALRMKAPILIYEDLLNEENMSNYAKYASSYTGNFTANAAWLEEALQKAIEEENYEQAAVLRDQLKHLKEPKS